VYDTEFGEWNGSYDQGAYNGFTYDNSNELCYDIDVKNDLVGPQLGWTMDYCCCCRWNVFMNSAFGIFGNHMRQTQRMWSGGGGDVQFANSGESFNVSSNKDDVSFLGELRAGVAYDITCHWRAVAAYRAVAMTGVATSTGQIPDNFSSRAEVAQINSDNSLVVHGVQVGAECRY
jgi:Putative beta barrel porin-7 (BBP7)